MNDDARPARSPAQWDPFMEQLRGRLRRERRSRRLRRVLYTLLAVGLVWALGTAPREERGPARFLVAEIPRGDAPLFQPENGSAVPLAEGTLLVRAGGGS